MILIAGLFALSACTGEEETGSVSTCGPNAPVIQSIWFDDCGNHEFEDEGNQPSLLVKADVTDADGDLHAYGMKMWFDNEIDGRVLQEGPFVEVYGAFDAEVCEVTRATIGMRFSIIGGEQSPTHETLTEFGFVVVDEAFNESAGPTEIVIETPDTDGSCTWATAYPGKGDTGT